MSATGGVIEGRLTKRQLARLLQRKEEQRGFLIAFEGPDGSGKTTQRKLFKKWLQNEGYESVTTKWNSSALIRPLIKARKKVHALSPQEFSLLHAADFRHRLETEILPALWAGKSVIADRYLFTALARDAARGLDLHWILNVYAPLFWPDVVFYFSVSPETSRKRISVDRTPSFYEAGQDITQVQDPLESYQQFMCRVIQEYDALALIFKFITVNAEQSIYSQHLLLRQMFQKVGRRPWAEWNSEAIEDWLARRSETLNAPPEI